MRTLAGRGIARVERARIAVVAIDDGSLDAAVVPARQGTASVFDPALVGACAGIAGEGALRAGALPRQLFERQRLLELGARATTDQRKRECRSCAAQKHTPYPLMSTLPQIKPAGQLWSPAGRSHSCAQTVP